MSVFEVIKDYCDKTGNDYSDTGYVWKTIFNKSGVIYYIEMKTGNVYGVTKSGKQSKKCLGDIWNLKA